LTDERWSSFCSYAAGALDKPTFDAEERSPRLTIAAELAAVFEQARAEGPWWEQLEQCINAPQYRTADLTTRSHVRLLADWLFGGDEALGAALSRFGDPSIDEHERLAAFVSAAESAGLAVTERNAVLALGSLFNFAAAPDRLPVMVPKLFRDLEELLGYPMPSGDSIPELYRHHIDFARDVEVRLRAAGAPVRDMLDVQAVIFEASRHWRFWAQPIEAATATASNRTNRRPKHYLSVCAIYRNEARYLREWIEFHRLVGVEQFVLYDNESTDDHHDVLASYLDQGIVELCDWSLPFDPKDDPLRFLSQGQARAYEHCLRNYGDRSRWIAFIDLDEFLFSPTGRPLPEVLTEYEQWPGVGVNWAVFGPSGHLRRPEGLVLENYVERLDSPASRTIKTIVDPSHVTGCIGAHSFRFDRLGAVDENHFPTFAGLTKSVSFSRLRINHYLTKSVEEYQRRAKGRVRGRDFDPKLVSMWEQRAERDVVIQQYLPALRQTLTAPQR
jgi:hypothetical protein